MQSSGQIVTTNIQIFTGRMPFLLPNQQRQSTSGKKYHIPRTCSTSVRKTAETKSTEQLSDPDSSENGC